MGFIEVYNLRKYTDPEQVKIRSVYLKMEKITFPTKVELQRKGSPFQNVIWPCQGAPWGVPGLSPDSSSPMAQAQRNKEVQIPTEMLKVGYHCSNWEKLLAGARRRSPLKHQLRLFCVKKNLSTKATSPKSHVL